MAHPEGPHLYTRNGWWYLVIAEGGTDRGHCVTLARSRSVSGPFEAHPGNPILTHRSTSSPVQSTGHADLVEGPDGRWWAVYLATRPRGKFPRYHVNGRETFLAQVHWVNDWPVLDEDAVSVPDSDRHFVDRFDGDLLDRRWLSRNHSVGDVATPGPAGATLVASRGDRDRVSGALLAVRTTDLAWQAAARVGAGDVALSVRLDDRHWVGVERVGDRLRVRAVIGPLDQMLAERLSGPGLALALRAVPPGDEDGAAPDRIEAGFVDDSGFCAMATIDGRYFSTEVAGGFTGRVVALEALNGEAIVSAFELCPVPQVSDAVPRLRGTTAVVGP